MNLTSYLVDVASDYTVHIILTSYLVGVAYDYTVYLMNIIHFEDLRKIGLHWLKRPMQYGTIFKRCSH